MAENEEEKSEWNEEILGPLDGLDLEAGGKYDNSAIVNVSGNYKTRICPKCGEEYGNDYKYQFCRKDGGKLLMIWKCQHCGEDLTKAQGYSAINVCPNCGKGLDEKQKKIINSSKSRGTNDLKKICTNPECREIFDDEFDCCGKCGNPTIPMQCSCGEIFRQREDGKFDKYCPKCGSLNLVELEKKKIEVAIALKRKQEEAERKKREAVEKARQEAIRRQKEEEKARSYKIGDTIQFGSYPFYADGREKAIDWIILDIDKKGNALVISDYALDNLSYNKDDVDITWEESRIRKWLNGTFINKAFTAEQRGKIINSRIENKDNAEYKTSGGNDTYDKLFLLSIEEANKYFKSDKARVAYPTPYAKSKKSVNGNLYVSRNFVSTYRGGSCWLWLRSPGRNQRFAAGVDSDGNVDSSGSFVYYDAVAVRVALWLDLNNL